MGEVALIAILFVFWLCHFLYSIFRCPPTEDTYSVWPGDPLDDPDWKSLEEILDPLSIHDDDQL